MVDLGIDGAFTGRGGRASARQAIAVLSDASSEGAAITENALDETATMQLHRACLLDQVAAVLQVNGASATLITTNGANAKALRRALPPGVDIEVAPLSAARTAAALSAWSIRRHLDRAFERVIVIRETALPLPPRTLATALSVLASADLVVGPTPGGGTYLVGARAAAGADCLASLRTLGAAEVERAALEDGLVLRRLEPRRAIDPSRGLDSLAADAERLGNLTSHLRRWFLAHRPGP